MTKGVGIAAMGMPYDVFAVAGDESTVPLLCMARCACGT